MQKQYYPVISKTNLKFYNLMKEDGRLILVANSLYDTTAKILATVTGDKLTTQFRTLDLVKSSIADANVEVGVDGVTGTVTYGVTAAPDSEVTLKYGVKDIGDLAVFPLRVTLAPWLDGETLIASGKVQFPNLSAKLMVNGVEYGTTTDYVSQLGRVFISPNQTRLLRSRILVPTVGLLEVSAGENFYQTQILFVPYREAHISSVIWTAEGELVVTAFGTGPTLTVYHRCHCNKRYTRTVLKRDESHIFEAAPELGDEPIYIVTPNIYRSTSIPIGSELDFVVSGKHILPQNKCE